MATDAKHSHGGLSNKRKAFTLSRKSKARKELAPFDGKVIVIFGSMMIVRDVTENLIREHRDIFATVIAHTTRAPNPDEIDGFDYFFVSHERMSIDARNGEFIEIHFLGDGNDMIGVSYTAYEYATKSDAKCVVVSTDVEGMKGLHSAGFQAHYIYITDENSCEDVPEDYYYKRFVIDLDLYKKVLEFAMEGLTPENEDLVQARQEWNDVEISQPEPGRSRTKAPVMTCEEAINFAKHQDLGQFMKKIRPTIPRRGFAALTRSIFGPPKLAKHLHADRDFVFTLAQWPFDNEKQEHFWILLTIYRKLTGANYDCQRFGDHWQDIGFQGRDPSTDLRGCGFLGLLTTLYFVTNPKLNQIMKDIFRLSQHETQNFPFCVMSINMTRIALHSLREELIARECNRTGEVLEVFCEFYSAVFYHMYRIWKKQKKTIADAGFLINDVSTYSRKNPGKVLKKFQEAVKDQRQLPQIPVNMDGIPVAYGIEYANGDYQEREVKARDLASFSTSSEGNEEQDERVISDISIQSNPEASADVQRHVEKFTSSDNETRDVTDIIPPTTSLSDNQQDMLADGDKGVKDYHIDVMGQQQRMQSTNFEGELDVTKDSKAAAATVNVTQLPVIHEGSMPTGVRDQSLSDVGLIFAETDAEKAVVECNRSGDPYLAKPNNLHESADGFSEEKDSGINIAVSNNIDNQIVAKTDLQQGSNSKPVNRRYDIANTDEHIENDNNQNVAPVSDNSKASKYSRSSSTENVNTNHMPSSAPQSGEGTISKDLKFELRSENRKEEIADSDEVHIETTKYAVTPEFNSSRSTSFEIDPNEAIDLQIDSGMSSYSSPEPKWLKNPLQIIQSNSHDNITDSALASVSVNTSHNADAHVHNNTYQQDATDDYEIEYFDDDCV